MCQGEGFLIIMKYWELDLGVCACLCVCVFYVTCVLALFTALSRYDVQINSPGSHDVAHMHVVEQRICHKRVGGPRMNVI